MIERMSDVTMRLTAMAVENAPRFHNPRRVDWGRASVVIGATVIFWSGMIEIVPESWHHTIMVVLASLQSAVVFLMKSGRD